MRVARHLFLLGALGLLALPAAAQAGPVTDCAKDGKLDRQYSNSELRRALGNIPTDLDEYGDCRETISAAIRNDSDKGDGRPSPTGADGGPLGPDEQAARTKDGEELAAIAADGAGDPPAPSVEVGGETVKPGSNGLFDLASASNDLPVPLLLALIALALLAIVGGLVALRARIPILGRLPLLSKIPAPRAFPRSRR